MFQHHIRLLIPLAFAIAACAEPPRDPAPPAQPQTLEDEPIEEVLIAAPTTALRFAETHAGLPAEEQLAHLRLRIYLDAATQDLWYRASGVTADGRDRYRVTDAQGHVTDHPMPAWTVTAGAAAELEAVKADLDGVTEQTMGDVAGIAARAAAAVTAGQEGELGAYYDPMIADLAAHIGMTDYADDEDDEADPDPPGGGGDPGMWRAADDDFDRHGTAAPGAAANGNGNADAVCAISFGATVAAHMTAMVVTARAIMLQIPKTVTACAQPVYVACAIEGLRLAALGVVAGGLYTLLKMHVDFHGQANEWVHEIEIANVGKQVNAEQAEANVANARGAALKRLTIFANGFAAVWAPVALAAGISGYKSVWVAVGSAVALSAGFIGCTAYVVNTFWQNAGVKLQANQGAPAGGPAGGRGGVGGGGGPAPPGDHLFGPGFPGFPADPERNPRMSPYLTAVPPALAVAQQLDIDLQAPVSPLTGQPMNNQQSVFSLQYPAEQWGLQLCTKLVPTVDNGGPYYWSSGDLMQSAGTPYFNYSAAFGPDVGWGAGIELGSTTIPMGFATITQQRVCDGDDNNDGFPDAGQPDGIDNDEDGTTDEAGETNRFCFDPDGDGLEELFSVSLDSQMPNRAPDRTINCGQTSLDVIPKPQLATVPGVDPIQVLAMQVGREISETTIVHVSSPYRVKSSGAKIGYSGQVRFKTRARMHLPTHPCVKYDRIYDPYGAVRYGYVWDSARPGCSSTGGGGGGDGPGGPML